VIKIFLKKIRLKGFKSFAEQTDIEIEENITAVVGPNGSGKSNIVDAIRWVLGEQSAKTLRGSRMSDIIFSGSEELHAKRTASVTLFFDNSEGILPVDGKELTLGRRVDDDGRSDYLINGASCRLKDIETLLMDSGLGSDGYSIVGQGRIDSIIHSKPDKMRLFFEEAAGIMKHKSRKEEAQKRLENTTNDLNRIHDIVEELEKRRGPLKKSAAKAEKFKKFKSELSELELSLLNKQWQELSEKFSDISDKRNSAQKELSEKESQYNTISYKLDTKKEELKKIKEDKEENNNNYFQNQNKLNEIENNLNLMDERRKNVIEQKDDLKNAVKDLKEERKERKTILEDCRETFEIINSDKEELEAEINKIKDKINSAETKLAEINEKIRTEENNRKDYQNSLQQKNSLVQRLEERVDISQERLSEIKDDNSALEDNLAEKESELNKTEEKLKSLAQKLEGQKKEKDQLETEISHLNNKLESGKEELQELKQNYQHKTSRLELMQEMQDNYEGYYSGVRNILEKKEEFPGLIDVVAEIISVKETHETAIETALGAKMQNIIVEDDSTAKKAVQFLKKNKKGRATFLPLNMVNGSRLADRYIKELDDYQGFIGLAVDLVDFPERLENIFNFLLGKIVVSDNLKNAVEMSKNISRNFRIVTKEGDVVYPGGAISGGSNTGNTRDLIGRSRKIEKLSSEKDNLKNKGKNLVSELEEVKKELDAKNEKLNCLEETLQNLKIEENNIINKKNRLEEEILELKQRIEVLNNNHSQLDSSTSENRDKIDEYYNQIAELKNSIQNKEKEIKELNSKKTNLEKSLEKLQPQLQALELDGARISEKRDNLREQLNEKEHNLAETQQKISSKENNLETLNSDLSRIEERKVILNQKKDELKVKEKELKKKKTELAAVVSELEKEVEAEEKELKDLQVEVNKLKDNFHELDLKYSKLESKLSNIKEILEDDYSLKPEEIDAKKLIEIEDEDEEEVERKIAELKSEMDKLHPVNEAAVEEFAELKDRLDYLHEQQSDLKHARKSIEIVIGDIEESMEKMFSRTFFKVKEQFSKVFKALFQGGHAELKLTDPDDMLTTGVEIQAQPPGKSLKTLSLLSGGERALTAIALIFAFIQVKPSPFYVLDEIDAPLDDVNIVRFASFIKRYAKVAQFIIITHRRYMMTEVDSLYGVTMEKSGVSRLISLKLEQDQEIDETMFEEAL
jgi:chromosome segregation protein